MYLPAHFEETREAELLALIREFPLGMLVLKGPQGLDANHIPFLVDEERGKRRLIAHVARANPLWKEAKDGDEALVVFRAEDAYVSPNWYPTKPEHHRHVPTWNYRVVHVHGRIGIRDDERFVRGVVARLTHEHEAGTGDARPWKMTDAPAEYVDQMLKNIVGLEVEVARMVGKFKLSQNRDERDRLGAAEALRVRGETALADGMKNAVVKKT
ncbi:MAG TPA: FMN-binding negative transcriptional regulator [Burkholderiales bacterium]|nr:FMN-binding negative transcriptional regulator [Burkholderiales bacterium]